MKLAIQWMNKFDAISNSFGYATHQKNISEAMQRNGVEISDDADIAFFIVPLCHYVPVKNKINIVYTMYEYSSLPANWINKLKDIDLLIVPCSHNKELFGRYTDVPISVCLEGTNTNYYKYVERNSKPNQFIWLWLGANNLRKGYLPLIQAWNFWAKYHPDDFLIIKTTPNMVSTKEDVRRFKNHVMIDSRKLPLDSLDSPPNMFDVYKYANAFIMPTMGEGFCLPLVEALATGLPCIYTNWSGPTDYMNSDIGYPVDYELVEVSTAEEIGYNKMEHWSRAAYADINSILRQMATIYFNYDIALEKGRRGAEMVRKKLTWDISAKNLIKTIKDFVR